MAFVADVVLLGGTIALFTTPNHQDVNSLGFGSNGTRYHDLNEWEIIEIIVDIFRVIFLFSLVGFYTLFTLEGLYKEHQEAAEQLDETTPLLANGHANGIPVMYPAMDPLSISMRTWPVPTMARQLMALMDPRQTAHLRAVEVSMKVLPFTSQLPRQIEHGGSICEATLCSSLTSGQPKSRRLQMVVLICVALMFAQRAVNMAVPLQIGVVTNQLYDKETYGMPWLGISLLIAFRFLQGTSGILGAVRSVLWIPISQYSYQALTTASFEHVHSLSLDFHLGKRTGEVLSALSKGNAINNFLEQVTFQVIPMVFDLGVAIVYFGLFFDAYYALTVTIITFSYLYLTIRMARWRSEQRRQMTNLSREEDAVKNDSLTSYETVKYFNAEEYEFNRYRKAVTAFQKMEYKVTISLNILNISQNLVFMTGLLCTSFIAAYQVTTNRRKVGDFVTLLTYMTQLQQPLNFFGSFYRSVQSAMISGERLLELFKEQPTVIDDPSASSMPTCEGQISFQSVKFSYDERKPALEDLSFTCRPGTTTAFVGESGGGKSTLFKLLFRFYNTKGGSIQVDGRDIKDVTIDSLRQHIGVVPQDTILFNETLMYNLKYANQDATDEEVYAACRAASIHDKIMTFPDTYNTKVGERGLRLSGGEKQRVAIARTIIKDPRIIMLDEATAALDSDTEQNIQEGLKALSRGRTMLVIA